MNEWMKPMMDFWTKSGREAGLGFFSGSANGLSEGGTRVAEEAIWGMPLKMAQGMFDSTLKLWSGKQESGSQMDALPGQVLSLMQMGLEGYVEMQERLLREMQEGSAGSAEGRREDPFGAIPLWTETMQRLFKPFLNAPTIGLTRSYQEQFNQVLDKYYAFSASMSELLYQLNVPLEEASKKVQEQMQEWGKEGKAFPEDKQSYDKWVATLEGCYMDLFKSPAYIQQLYKTIDSYSDFLSAQQQVYGNSLRNLPVATTKDLDELSKEIYLLKKKLKETVKRMNVLDPATEEGMGAPGNGTHN